MLQWSELYCSICGVQQKLFCNCLIVGWYSGACHDVHCSMFAWVAYDLPSRSVGGCCAEGMICHWLGWSGRFVVVHAVRH